MSLLGIDCGIRGRSRESRPHCRTAPASDTNPRRFLARKARMTSIAVAPTVPDLRRRAAAWRAEGRRIALVPTMGALHEGHLSLVRLAKARADRAVVSIFVNPTQFGPGEDFEAYPRNEAGDAALLASVGCDLIYAPSAAEMYPPGFATTVSVAGVSEALDGIG